MPMYLDDVLRWIANQDEVKERAEEVEDQEHPATGDPCKSLMLVGPPRSGKTVTTHAMAREIILPPVNNQFSRFEASMRVFPKIELNRSFGEMSAADRVIDQLTEGLAIHADETGLQTDKTHDISEENKIGTITKGQLDFSVSHELAQGRVNLSLDVSDLSGEWFNQHADYLPLLLDQSDKREIPKDLEADFEQFSAEIGNAVQAGILLITIPFRYPKNTRLSMRVMIGMYLNALTLMTRHMLESHAVKRLPQVVFCFTKYEAAFSEEDLDAGLPGQAASRKVAHGKLAQFFAADDIHRAIWQMIRRFYIEFESISQQYGVPEPSVWLACMSAFGFTAEGAPNLGVRDENETDHDVLAESSAWRNGHAGDFEFDILKHWRPMGVMQPFYMAAAPFLSPGPEFVKRAMAEDRPMLNFREFAQRVPSR